MQQIAEQATDAVEASMSGRTPPLVERTAAPTALVRLAEADARFLSCLEVAQKSLHGARDLQERKKALDGLAGLAVAGRRIGATLVARNELAEVYLREVRRFGADLTQLERGRSGRSRKNAPTGGRISEYRGVLDQAGVSTQQASRWQQCASLPDDRYRQWVAKTVEARAELTESGLRAVARGAQDPALGGQSDPDSDERYTPKPEADDVRKVFGGKIDLDPFSCESANRTVRAVRIFTKTDNGLIQEWRGKVFVQPPFSGGGCGKAFDKLDEEMRAGRVPEAISLTNASISTRWWQRAAGRAEAVCFEKGRINYLCGGNRNRFDQSWMYFGANVKRFKEVFEHRGVIGKLR
jgi:ParB family chromosome partitioning protein